MAEVIHWQDEANQAEVVRQAAQALEHGMLVAFPDGVAASALVPEVVERLCQLNPHERPTLALPGPEHALHWAPGLSPAGLRLGQRLWPAPLTLLCPHDGDGLASQLPDSVRQHLCGGGEIALCVPDQPALWYTLLLAASPILLAPAGANSDAVALRIQDGEPKIATVVRVHADRWELLREGALTRADLEATTRRRVLFVCTGNTCRSPMAAALFRKLLAERLGCSVTELAQRGYEISSAGIAALPGEPAAPEAIEAVRELGADLAGHASQPLTPDQARRADFLITMTRGHQGAIYSLFDQVVEPRTLCPQGSDVADPIGAGPEVYRLCAREILAHLEHWIAELERPCA